MTLDIGDRIKRYEAATALRLVPRSYTIIRVDGKAFHSLTRGCDRPFDYDFMDAMEYTAEGLFTELSGALFAYQQSDEISVILQDFASHNTEPWMGGVVQKQASVAASIATARFNQAWDGSSALFDARTFTIPSLSEAMNYLIWRQLDATRNSVNMAASSVFSHKSLHGLNMNERQDKLFNEAGINWNNYPTRAKRGSGVIRERFVGPVTYYDANKGMVTLDDIEQSRVVGDRELPVFSSEGGRAYLESQLVPSSGAGDGGT